MSTNVNDVFTAMLSSHGENELTKMVLAAAERERAKKETSVQHAGKAIVLPAEPLMDIAEAIEILQMRQKAAEEEYDFHEKIDGYPFDVAAAFHRAISARYGFVNSVSTQREGMWGMTYDALPDMRQIRTGPKPEDIIQVPMGGFQLPGFDSPIDTQFFRDRYSGKVYFTVKGQLKAKDRQALLEILADTRRELQARSIYRNRALILRVDEGGDIAVDVEPEFMDTSAIDPKTLILSRATEKDIEINLLTLIKNTAECREHNIPLKRAVTLAGPYGTGKTLCASTLARHCIDSGEWTFILVDNPSGLAGALEFAKNFQPAVVFAEDVDRIVNERDEAGNKLMDAADGALAKNSEIIMVLTTNNLEKIHPAMLRAGRIDSIIPVEAPDAEAATRLIRYYAGALLPATESLARLGEKVEGHIASVLAEIVKRSKLAMVARGGASISEQDLLIAAESMESHISLAKGKIAPPIAAHERLGLALTEMLANGAMASVKAELEEIKESL